MSREAARRAIHPCQLGLVSSVVLVVVALTACGGGGGGDAKRSPTATPTAEGEGTAVNRDPIQIETRVAKESGAQFADEAEAKPGDYVQVRTLVRTKPDSDGRNLVISIPRSGDRLEMRARPAQGETASTAVVRGASGKALRLTALRYACFAPPAPTFCPLRSVRVTKSGYVVRAKVRRTAPVVLTFTAQSR